MNNKLKQIEKRIGIFNILLITYVFVNIIQAIFTPIHDDEAYYWVYSNNLDWGYFDHPPAVALIVKIGTLFFDFELGVRFFTIFLSLLSIIAIWKLIPKEVRGYKNSALVFFGILISIPGFNMYSFITTPDVPLLFSFILYLLALKKLIEKQTLLNSMLWALTAAMLIYSKYHGGIIILLSIIVYPKLLKQWTTYLAGFIALVLISPHLYWQYTHDFISFRYHLFQRTSGVFTIDNPIGYIGGTFGILNPALFVLVILLTYKFRDLISAANRFYLRMFWGIIIFFFFYSFRSRIEAHWVVTALVPMTVILHELIVKNKKYQKSIKYIAIVSISLLIIVRFLFVFSSTFQEATLGTGKEYYASVKKVIPEDRKIVFFNSFQNASKYKFFFNEEAFSYNSVYYRKNQYDLGEYDKDFNNSKVVFKGWWNDGKLDTLRLDNNILFRYAYIDDYTIFTKVNAVIDDLPQQLKVGEHEVNISIENPYDYDIIFGKGRFPLTLRLLFQNIEEKKYFVNLSPSIEKLSGSSTYSEDVSFTIGKNIPEGEYDCQVVINYIYPQYISQKWKVKIQ